MREMDKLRDMLSDAGIEFESFKKEWSETNIEKLKPSGDIPFHDQVVMFIGGAPCVSAISNFGSHGGDEGLIEVWDYHCEVEGYLTAEQAFDRFARN